MDRPAAAMCRAGIVLLLAFAIAACDKPAPAPVTLRIGVYPQTQFFFRFDFP